MAVFTTPSNRPRPAAHAASPSSSPSTSPSVSAVVPPAAKLRRRPGRIVVAVALVAAGALAGVFGWGAVASAHEVVAIRVAVDRGEVITAASLITVRVGTDPTLRTVPAAELDRVVGRRAAADLSVGSLLTPEQTTDADVPPVGYSVVGVPLEFGMLPTEPLRPGDAVRFVQTPGAQGDVQGTPVAVTAKVVRVTAGDTKTVVDLLVPEAMAPELAARANTGRGALVLDSGARR